MKTINICTHIIIVVALAACQPAEREDVTVTHTEDDRQALMQMDAAYERALQAGDASAVAALHANDAIVLPANSPMLRGRAAIEADFADRYAEEDQTTLTTEEVVFSAAGDMAYVVGSSIGPDGAGKYLTVYRRTGDGWEIVADAWNSDQPPATDG